MSVIDMNDHIEKNMLKDLMNLERGLDDDELQEITDGVGAMMNAGCKPSEVGYFMGVVHSAMKEGYTAGYAVQLAFIDPSAIKGNPPSSH